ncbi:MAG: hypothetical protein FK734_07805 [Asgard group archaeon]|nr:hypothetical protein [Asgard group archaeon]
MLERDFKELGNDEQLRIAFEEFQNQKELAQDHLLERTELTHDDTVEKISIQYNLQPEIAKVIYVLEFEYDLPRILTTNYFKGELQRLIDANYEIPDIYSFRVQFSIGEGFWIKHLITDFPKQLLRKMTKLITIDRSLFGDLQGEVEDSALYIMERTFIINEIIKPMLFSWMKEHQRATYFDAVKMIICMMQRKSLEKGEVIVSELCNRFSANIDSVGNIINELDKTGWAYRAINEFEEIKSNINQCHGNMKKMGWRIASEIILENRLIMEYIKLDLATNIDITMEKMTLSEKKESAKTLAQKKERMITDKLSITIPKLANESEDFIRKNLRELIIEYAEEATLRKHQKPTIFAKEFLDRVLLELDIDPDKMDKLRKNFDHQMMYRLSASGGKEFQNIDLNERIFSLLEEILVDVVIRSKDIIKQLEEEELQASLEIPKKKVIEMDEEPSLIEKNEEKVQDRIKGASEKDLWIIIRDMYLKELFDCEQEILAAAKVLKKLSLELGLLLTESEATNHINTELENKGIEVTESNREEIDANICKIVYARIKEERKYR